MVSALITAWAQPPFGHKLQESENDVLTTKGAAWGGMLAVWCAHSRAHNRGGELLFQRGISTTFGEQKEAESTGKPRFKKPRNIFPVLRTEDGHRGKGTLLMSLSKV